MGKQRNLEVEQAIIEFLAANQKLSMKEAKDMFGLSESTLRRLFIKLEEEKRAIRIIGGISAAAPDSYYSYELLSQRHKPEKERIGKYAASLILPSDFIYIDCGTTTACLSRAIAQLIKDGRLPNTLNIITNSLANLEILTPYCNIVLTGGSLNMKRRSFVSTFGMEFLKNFRFSKGFFGADGMTTDHGFFCDNIAISQMTRAALLQTAAPYVLLDSSKIGVPSYVNYASLNEACAIITDAGISETDKEALGSRNIQLLTAD